MSRKLRNIKPRKVNRGAFEEQNQREEKKAQNQRALLIILPLVMLAVLAIGIFFGYKFYLNHVVENFPVSPSETSAGETAFMNPMFLKAVNPASPLEQGFVPDTVDCRGVLISTDAVDNLEQMLSDAEKDGYKIKAAEGYVSYEDQQERYETAVANYRKKSKASLVMAEAYVQKSIAQAGESEQQTGLLVALSDDSGDSFDDTPAFMWLMRHGVDYGFILRYPEKENAGGVSYSPNLFRFVGREYAYQMRELDMNFDEFILYLSAK